MSGGAQGERAADRVVWQVAGADRFRFLQGLISNDMLPLEKAPGILWAALLSPQGKYLADFFVIRPEGADHLLIDIHQGLAEATLRRLTMYRLRAEVQITPTSLPVARGLGAGPEGSMADPRHPALGWRAYGIDGGPPAIDWDQIRVAHCIPDSLIELIVEDSYLLECGFERLHGVDFRKGCYVGQEVTARMKHKTELRKGLAQVRLSAAVPVGTTIMAGEKEVGTVFTQSGGLGLAYLRFDRANGPMMAGAAVVELAEHS
jgi:folate-binding protein YgfZ